MNKYIVTLGLVLILLSFLFTGTGPGGGGSTSSTTVSGPPGYSSCVIPVGSSGTNYVTGLGNFTTSNVAGNNDIVNFAFAISPNAPYCVYQDGFHITFIAYISHLYDSNHNLLDTAYIYPGEAHDQPGISGTNTFAFQRYIGYPGFPHGTYQIDITAYDCVLANPPMTPLGPFTACPVTSTTATGSFTV